MHPRFIGEDIEPVPGTGDTTLMARGQPGVPRRFHWRGREYVVARVIGESRRLGPCVSGGGEQYVRKHVYTVETECGVTMKLSCDRAPRRGAPAGRPRWRLLSVMGEGKADGR